MHAWYTGTTLLSKGPRSVEESRRRSEEGLDYFKFRATLGPEPGNDKEVSILNRIVRWCDDCLLYEADPRHVEKLLREAGLESCKSVTTPGVKEASDVTSTAWFEESGLSLESEGVSGELNLAADAAKIPDLRFLDREEMRSFRAAVARCNYLVQARFEIAFTTKGAMQSDVETDARRREGDRQVVPVLKGIAEVSPEDPFR